MPQPNAKLKLRDIARLTGHTVGTVSKALHNKPGISSRTRERILKIADEAGYIGNALAGSLRSGTTRTAAIILGDIANPLFALMAKALIASLARRGYSAILLNTDEDRLEEERAVVTALSRNVDGVLLCPTQRGTHCLELLRRNGTPCVLVGRRFDDDALDSVVFDDFQGGRLAAEHLLALGHRRILQLCGSSCVSSARERRLGFEQALRASGLEPDPALCRQIDITADASQQLEDALREDPPFSAVFAFSDYIAWQALYALSRRGLRVPDQVSVIGFDDIQSDLRLPVELSSIACDRRALGERAVELLLRRVQCPAAERVRACLPTALAVRATTAAIG